MNTIEVLEAGLLRLRVDGWVNGPPWGDEKLLKNCTISAISYYGDTNTKHRAVGALAKAAEELFAKELIEPNCIMPINMSLPRWNDSPGRTFEDVEAVYLRAIANERAKISVNEDLTSSEEQSIVLDLELASIPVPSGVVVPSDRDTAISV